ncbi:flagellar basal-body rod modification protein FlgD [Vibrio astriarenae]|nr:flagellar basal-body rod modification protein FlgD [Vibrio sp. C7]
MNNLVTGADQATSIQSPSTQAPSENPNSGEALKNEFITLMVAQIENQDPLNPTDGTEYVAQLAQFSQVESSENLVQLMQNNTSVLNDLQVLSAANLVDQSVSVRTNRVNIEQGNGLEGYIDLQAPSSSVTLELLNSRGEVSTYVLGSMSSGKQTFSIDGEELSGEYQIRAVVDKGQNYLPDIYIDGLVEQVTTPVNGGTSMLSVSSVGDVSFYDISAFN